MASIRFPSRTSAIRTTDAHNALIVRLLRFPAQVSVCLLGNSVRARANFMVTRVMRTGETMLFASGCYEDRVVLDGSGAAHFAEKAVVLDSRQIDTLLAMPL